MLAWGVRGLMQPLMSPWAPWGHRSRASSPANVAAWDDERDGGQGGIWHGTECGASRGLGCQNLDLGSGILQFWIRALLEFCLNSQIATTIEELRDKRGMHIRISSGTSTPALAFALTATLIRLQLLVPVGVWF